MVRTQTGGKKLWGHRACSGDIMQNIVKMGVFCSFSEGSLGRVLQKLACWCERCFRLMEPISVI